MTVTIGRRELLAALGGARASAVRSAAENPFDGQKRKAGGESYSAFQPAELPLPWAARIAAYTGMRSPN
jgi:hypothetical protein